MLVPAEQATPLEGGLARQGQWLFRWRSYIPLPLLLMLGTWLFFHPPAVQDTLAHYGWELFCLAVGMLGLAMRAWVVGHAPRGTSGRNTREQEASTLNTTGAYSVVRHPLYVGNYFMWLSVALFTRSVFWVVLTTVYFWICYERIMIAEERFLFERFGEAFLEWASRTPALLPALGLWKPPRLPFSWRSAARREYSGMFGLVLALGLLEMAEEAGRTGNLALDRLWIGLLVGAGVVYLLLRTLKHRTDVLRVSGR